MPINYNEYPPDWAERRERIMRRAWYCCEHCGLPDWALIVRSPWSSRYRLLFLWEHYELNFRVYVRGHLKEIAFKEMGITWVILTIAHLDHDPENWEVADDRLAALCQRCHLLYDRGQRRANKSKKVAGNHQLKLEFHEND